MLTDSHCHISKKYYENIDKLIEEAKQKGVHRFILGGSEQNSNVEIINLISMYEEIYGTLGIHPNEVLDANEEWFEYIKKNYKNKKIIAIGEIGLDYHYGKENIELQKEWFNRQLKFAEENNLPVVIHSREATQDTLDILKKYKVKGVMHSFSGSYEIAKEYIKLGFKLGINGTVTFKNSKLKENITKISIDDIILETDCPYLTPEPYRGQKNHPKYILDIAKYIADLYEISIEELSRKTEENIAQIFDI